MRTSHCLINGQLIGTTAACAMSVSNASCSCSCSCSCPCSCSCCSVTSGGGVGTTQMEHRGIFEQHRALAKSSTPASYDCSCSCPCSCSCSCFVCSSRTFPSAASEEGGALNAAGRCSVAGGFETGMLNEAPQLLRFRKIPIPSAYDRYLENNKQAALLLLPPSPPPPPPTSSESVSSSSCCKSSSHSPLPTTPLPPPPNRRLMASVGIQAGAERTARGTSPPKSALMSTGTNTDLIGEMMLQQEKTLSALQQELAEKEILLLQQSQLARERAERCLALEAQQREVELALRSIHEQLEQRHEFYATTMSALLMAEWDKQMSNMRWEEGREREFVQLYEAEMWGVFTSLMESLRQVTFSLLTERSAHKNSIHTGLHLLKEKHNNALHSLVLSEEHNRAHLLEMESLSYSRALETFGLSSDVLRASLCAASAASEQSKAETLATSVQRDLREALEREKELRFLYLNALRLPTTTISCSCKARGGSSLPKSVSSTACGGAEVHEGTPIWEDDDIPVHMRFIRAHKAAAEAVNLQRRCSAGLRCLL